MTDNRSTEKLWTPTFVFLMIVTFCGSISANGVHNGVTILIENIGGSATLTGVVICCFALTALVSRLVVGNLSDTYGRKAIIAAGGLFLLAGCIVALLTESVYWLIPSRILMGLGFSAVITVGSAAAADVIPKSRLGEGMGYQSMAYAVAMALGPMIAIALAQGGRIMLFSAFAVVAIAAFVMILPCKLPKIPQKSGAAAPESEGAEEAQGQHEGEDEGVCGRGGRGIRERENKGIYRFLARESIRPAIITVLVYIPMSLYMSYIALYAATAHVEGIWLFFILAAVTMVAIRMILGKAFDVLHINKLLILALLVGGLGFALMMLLNNTFALLAASICYGVFCGIAQPLLLSESIRRAPDYRRGAASATFYIGNDAGFASGAFIWGLVIASFGFTFTFAVNIAIVIVTVIASAVLLRD